MSKEEVTVLFTSEDRELVERVATYLMKEVRMCSDYKVKVQPHPYITGAWPVSSRDVEHIGVYRGRWCATILGVSTYTTTLEHARRCAEDYVAGFEACRQEWEKAEEVKLVRTFEAFKRKATQTFDLKECSNCQERVECLTKELPRNFNEGHTSCGLPLLVTGGKLYCNHVRRGKYESDWNEIPGRKLSSLLVGKIHLQWIRTYLRDWGRASHSTLELGLQFQWYFQMITPIPAAQSSRWLITSSELTFESWLVLNQLHAKNKFGGA
jgi:hypothetical protein